MWLSLYFSFAVCILSIKSETITENGSIADETISASIADEIISAKMANRLNKIEEQLADQLDSFQRHNVFASSLTSRCMNKIQGLEVEVKRLKNQLADMSQEQFDYKQLIAEFKYENVKIMEKLNSLEAEKLIKKDMTGLEAQVTTNCTNYIKHARHERSLTVYAFSAYLSYEINSKASDTVLIFDGIILNEGNSYNKYTGIYTVPQSGVYVFHFSIEWTNDEIVDVCLKLNGVQQNCAVVHPYDTHGQMSSNTVVLRATAGQRVWIENLYGVGAFYGHPKFRLTTFSGYLLY